MTLQGGPARAYLRHEIRDKDVGDEIMTLGISVIRIVIECVPRLIRCLEILIINDAFDAGWCQNSLNMCESGMPHLICGTS